MIKYLVIILCFISIEAFGQVDSFKKEFYFGPNISYGYSMYETFGDVTYIPFIEVGFFLNSKISSKINGNIGLNFSHFGEYSYTYDGFFNEATERNPFDTIHGLITGELIHKASFLSIPIRGEYYLSKKRTLGIIGGVTARFRLADQVSWEYRDIERNRFTQETISESDLIKNSPRIKFFKLDILHIGFLFKIKKLKIIPIANLGIFRFENSREISQRSRLDLSIELSWAL